MTSNLTITRMGTGILRSMANRIRTVIRMDTLMKATDMFTRR